MDPVWEAVDDYFAAQLIAPDAALAAALIASDAAGLPAIQVTASQGQFLALLAQLSGARRILEIGTLGGYSTIWLARALPSEGALVSLELDARHAEVARANIAHAGLQNQVTVRVAPALESLRRLAEERVAPFDFVFIDADKVNIDAYVKLALALSHIGTIMVVDNVVREGAVIDATSADESVQGVRRLTAWLATEPRVTAVALQTVGSKGYDGFLLARVTAS